MISAAIGTADRCYRDRYEQFIRWRKVLTSFLAAETEIVDFHIKAFKFASVINQVSMEQNKRETKYPLASGALFSLSSDAVALHRSIMSLCESGWAFACSIILRSLLDCLISVGIICGERDQAEYMGFKYTHFHMKEDLAATHVSEELKRITRTQLKEGITKLPVKDRERAELFFRQKMRGYWFCPEYKRPSDYLNSASSPDIQKLYSQFSGSAHASFVGMRLLRDQPDYIHPNPRQDKRGQNMALAGSTRLLVEITHLRGTFELGDIESSYRTVLEEFQELRKYLE